MLINLIVVPLNLPLFILAGIKILFSLTGSIALTNLANFFLNGTVQVLYEIIAIGRDTGSVVFLKTPTIYSLGLFYIALLLIFIFKKRIIVLVSAFCVVMIVALWYGFTIYSPEKLICFQPAGAEEPCVIICNPAVSSAAVINYPDYREFSLKNILSTNGIKKISSLYLGKVTPRTAERLMRLAEIIKIDKIFLLPLEQNGKRKNSIIEKIQESGITAEYYSPGNMSAFGKEVSVVTEETNPGRSLTKIKFDGHEYPPIVMLNTNKETCLQPGI
jgi:hypothetical protein